MQAEKRHQVQTEIFHRPALACFTILHNNTLHFDRQYNVAQ